MTTIDWNTADRRQDALDRASAARDLAAWECLDSERDPAAEAHLDRLLEAFEPKPAHRHDLVESGMTDECRYGCKVFRCSCGETEVRHYASYGCRFGLGEVEASARAGAR